MAEEKTPEQSRSELDNLFGKAGELVPAVDPADLKALWTYGQELRVQYPNGGVGTDIKIFKHMCSPGADTGAVWYRCAMLSLLEGMLESAWPGGQLSETALTVAAQIELKWMGVGKAHHELPFDVGNFLAQVHGMSLYNSTQSGGGQR